MTTVRKIDEAEQLRLEKELALALGWKNVEIGGVFDDDLFGTSPGSAVRVKLEPWTRDWYGCTVVMVEYGAFPQADFASGNVVGVTVFAGEPFQASVLYENCEDQHTAVRCAIVEALTKKLVHEREVAASTSSAAGRTAA